jgi:hypothetical protein
MISLLMKNRPWSGHPRPDFIKITAEGVLVTADTMIATIQGYRIDGGRLAPEPTPNGYLKQYWGWYHPATAWEIEEFKHLGGQI